MNQIFHSIAPACRTDKGYVLDEQGNCFCPPNHGIDEDENCVPCPFEKGMLVIIIN